MRAVFVIVCACGLCLRRKGRANDVLQSFLRRRTGSAGARVVVSAAAGGVGSACDCSCLQVRTLCWTSHRPRYQEAEGYDYTIVNGEITFEGQKCTGATPGRLLRHGRAA